MPATLYQTPRWFLLKIEIYLNLSLFLLAVFERVQVDIGLTEEGQKRWSDVVALVHACARQVRELPPDEVQRIWKEARDMSAIYLRFQQVSECVEACNRGGRGGCGSANVTELGEN